MSNPEQPKHLKPKKRDASRFQVEEVSGGAVEQDTFERKIKRHPNESQAAYLARVGEVIRKAVRLEKGPLAKQSKINEQDLSPATLDLIEKAMQEVRRETPMVVSQQSNKKIIESIEKSLGTHEHEAKPRDEEAYEKTERSRNMFDRGDQKRGETYWNTLFFPYNTQATRAYAKEILDAKTIVLLGGGRARLKEEMQHNGIHPKEVLNIDPFVSQMKPGADSVIPASASDKGLPELLRERGVKKVDEIWAEYSVPAYLDNPEEIRQLFQNIDALLAENGTARIWPTMVREGSTEEVSMRAVALREALDALNETGRYEIIEFEGAGRPGFTLHKVK